MTRLQVAVLTAGSILSLATSTAAAAAASAPGVVGFDFSKHLVDARDYPHLSRRQSKTVQADLTNGLLLYVINVTVGTPPQPFSLQLDTGSSDIWFPDIQADLCQQQACIFGAYDPSASSTFQDQQEEFQISYVDGTNIVGEYITDVLHLGSTKITNMTMAAATQLRTPAIGIMGIGYQADESIAQFIEAGQGGALTPTIVNQLKDQGYINSLAYSLWLNDITSNTGSILFGGVDTAKFHGDLVALPIQLDSQSGTLSSFTVAWTGLSITSGGSTSDFSPKGAQPIILDSGTTDLLLPDDIANSIFNGVGVITDENYGNLVPCGLANDDATFAFTFGGPNGPTVKVAIGEFVSPLYDQQGQQATFSDGKPACSFGIDAAGSNPLLFGDAFLRSAYVVYDLEDNTIALAQTNFNATGSNVKAFSGSAIPGVSSTATGVSVTQTFSGYIQPTASETAVATGSGIAGTSRSATFHLSTGTATGSSSGSSSTSSSGSSSGSGSKSAASSLQAPSMNSWTVLAGMMAAASFALGSSLIFL